MLRKLEVGTLFRGTVVDGENEPSDLFPFDLLRDNELPADGEQFRNRRVCSVHFAEHPACKNEPRLTLEILRNEGRSDNAVYEIQISVVVAPLVYEKTGDTFAGEVWYWPEGDPEQDPHSHIVMLHGFDGVIDAKGRRRLFKQHLITNARRIFLAAS